MAIPRQNQRALGKLFDVVAALRRSKPLIGLLLGVLTGIGIATTLYVNGVPKPKQRVEVLLPTPLAAESFVARMQKMHTSTWAINGEFTRLLDGKSVYSVPLKEVQRPPERLYRVGDRIFASLRGHEYTCVMNGISDANEIAKPTCQEVSGSTNPWSTGGEWLHNLQMSVATPSSPYVVAEKDDGCYVLQLVRGTPQDQWGTRAEFCFDVQTSAIRRQTITRGQYRDRVEVLDIRTEVNDDDLKLPERKE